ncbi:hypothetical protein EV183_004002 [Coemansia sp. RSA 2336]|nr:hypothetical protein EV183_004002 [Coemansia sp. RSA 2336]
MARFVRLLRTRTCCRKFRALDGLIRSHPLVKAELRLLSNTYDDIDDYGGAAMDVHQAGYPHGGGLAPASARQALAELRESYVFWLRI